MSKFDPLASYDLIDPEGIKLGEVRKGLYYESGSAIGWFEGDVFHYNGKPGGRLDGLTITRDDPPGEPLTQCELVLQEL
ncbi:MULTISPECIES: hypothetical protein [Pseudomonas]|uniref:Uncharacterized protein n=1 Tax=Pseudomonas putida TaxID=303 RepID=A0AAW6PUP1_PSEPU|nr:MULTISPECIES: hypothetical protein [Pseudomonas]MBH3469069.1 hypothetical protein [Pseudomonas putida]MCE0778718.1 hypothetical protein [Pseudomonas sp. NMI542_15]MCE1021557.1 hypothetical protein [Pseudomonas monteilii]MCE1038847.1 hypothetical protein [Pseudomonas monteilii]MCE1090758.1 hypothetical protein [Pseudomonas monteilii]